MSEEKPEISVDVTDEKIIVTRGEDFVEGDKIPSLGQKKKIQNIMRPKKMRVRDEEDVTMYLDDYSYNKDMDLYILNKMLTGWSKDKKITQSNLLKEKKLVPLLEKFVEKFKKINDIGKKQEDDEKKQND